MPELPEVESVVRSVAPHILGQTIRQAHLYSHRVTRADLTETARRMQGRTIRAVRRRGKQIFLDLDQGAIYIHLGMTGKLLWDVVPGKYARAVLELDGGTLVYDDVRQFGRVEFFKDVPAVLERVGPDALTISLEEFQSRLKKRSGKIKPLLLDQSFVSGVGNIYADELLFAARIHPKTPVKRLSNKRIQALHSHLAELLALAIEHRGSSISDYVDGAGERGGFQDFHSVYGKAGQPCPRCGQTIRRIVLAQRGTHYCPRCQRV